MATISEILQTILAARYGRDVRQSIHDGIEMCYDDVSDGKTLADAAADNANSKATLAENAATNANEKASIANTAATNANDKAALANTAAGTANTAATNANQKASLADTAATNANTKAGLADTAASNANAAADHANSITQPYVHIRYSINQPTSNADLRTTPSNWIGIYTGPSSTAPTNYNSYSWFKYKGEPGDIANHVHGNITNDGKIGSVADKFLITGTSGIIEAKDPTSVVDLVGISNPNILHNSDFRNPINQREAVGDLTTGQYPIDRWFIPSGTVGHVPNALRMYANSFLKQRIEPDLRGVQVTITLKRKGFPIFIKRTAVFRTSSGQDAYALSEASGVTLYMGSETNGVCYVMIGSTVTTDIERLKLEIGPNSTLHLDPPMDHAIELPKCQRFFFSMKPKSGSVLISDWTPAESGNRIVFSKVLQVRMRVTPTLSVSGSFKMYRITSTITEIVGDVSSMYLAVASTSDHMVYIVANCAQALTVNVPYRIQGSAVSDHITLSADL